MAIPAAHETGTAIVCNLNEEPGYSEFENPLSAMERTMMLPGDARKSLETLTRLIKQA